jgi:hypothetical protein
MFIDKDMSKLTMCKSLTLLKIADAYNMHNSDGSYISNMPSFKEIRFKIKESIIQGTE